MEMMACHGNQQIVGSEPQDGVRGFSLTAEKTAHSEPSTWEFTIDTSDHQIPSAYMQYYEHSTTSINIIFQAFMFLW
jgi:hypothetical protein